ncbi:MAG: hypothetical protein ACXWQO_02225 [Bdellovibrionota bacterium]
MKKILALMIVSSLMSVAAMAKVGETKEVNCKDVVKKIREMQDKKPGANGQSDDSAPAVKGSEKEAK